MYNNKGVIFYYSSSSHIESEISLPISSLGYVPDPTEIPGLYHPGSKSTKDTNFVFFTAMFFKIPSFWDVVGY